MASGKKYADNWEAKMATGRLSRQPRACADLLQRLRSAGKEEMSLRTCERGELSQAPRALNLEQDQYWQLLLIRDGCWLLMLTQ